MTADESTTDMIDGIDTDDSTDIEYTSRQATPAEMYELGDGLDRVHELVTADRNDTHGDPLDNHRQIAELWSAFLRFKLDDDEQIEPWEAAIMMQHVKQSRMQAGRLTADHFDDTAGYAEVGRYCAINDPDVEVDLE